MMRRFLGMVILSLFVCSSAFAISVDGQITAGEWDGFSHTDPIGANYGTTGLDATHLSEHNGCVDMDMWGAKVEGGTFYAMFRLADEAQRDVSEYDLVPAAGGKSTKIFLGYTIDVDPLQGTGRNHSQINGEWDMMLEIGVDYGQLLNPAANSVNVWNGTWTDATTLTHFDVAVNVTASAGRDYDGKVVEFSVPVADIVAAFDDTFVTPTDNWLVAGRVDGALRLGAGDYKADIGSKKLVNADGTGVPVGDADLDGDIDADDLATWGANYTGAVASDTIWTNGDFDQDGDVDADDLASWGANYTGVGGGGSMTAVPEPVTMSLLALGGAALVRRRRK